MAKNDSLALVRQNAELALKLVLGPPVSDVTALALRISELKKVANVLMPSLAGFVIPQKQAVSLAMVMLEVDPAQGAADVYQAKFTERDPNDWNRDEVALKKEALLKIIGAAGFAPVVNRRLDDGTERDYCSWTVMLEGRDITGAWIPAHGSKQIDLRDGSAETKLMKPDQLLQQRSQIVPLCETKALLRACRAIPGMPIPQKMSRAKAALPWIAPRLVPFLDMNDPADAQALREQALGLDRRLYGASGQRTYSLPPAALAPPAAPPAVGTTVPDDVEPGEIIDVNPVNGGEGSGARREVEAPARSAGSTPAPSTTRQREPGDDDEDLGDVAGLKHEPDGPALILCLCPCGCQAEISEEVAAKTKAAVGSPRCRDCFPSGRFSFDKHRDVKDFKLPKHPGLTLEDIRRNVERQRKAK